jgi:hypothetical protein
MDMFDGDPIATCEAYKAGTLSADDRMNVETLTGEMGAGFYGRETGLRFMTSAIAEIAVKQRWNIWFVLEGAPFQSERALYTDYFSRPLFKSDFGTYGRVGATYKF